MGLKDFVGDAWDVGKKTVGAVSEWIVDDSGTDSGSDDWWGAISEGLGTAWGWTTKALSSPTVVSGLLGAGTAALNYYGQPDSEDAVKARMKQIERHNQGISEAAKRYNTAGGFNNKMKLDRAQTGMTSGIQGMLKGANK